MNQVLRRSRRAMALLGWIEAALLVLLLLNIVANIMAQVVSRYIFDTPLIWVEEAATYSFIWTTFIGAALGLKLRRHVNIETFFGMMTPRWRALARAGQTAIILVILGILAPSIWAAIGVEMRRSTISLPVDIPAAWFFSVPFMFGAISLFLTGCHQMAAALNEAAGGEEEIPIMSLGADMDEDDFEAMEKALERDER